MFEQLEARLLGARRVIVEAHVTATGAATADLRGKLDAQPRNRLALDFGGDFGGRVITLTLNSNGRVAQLASGFAQREEAVGTESNRAALLGFTRSGLLPNLLRLAAQQNLDHAQGQVAQWLTAEGFQPGTYAMGGPLEGSYSFGYEVMHGGGLAGRARLWLDPKTTLPRRREQTLRVPAGEVRVVEEYERIVIE